MHHISAKKSQHTVICLSPHKQSSFINVDQLVWQLTSKKVAGNIEEFGSFFTKFLSDNIFQLSA